MTLLSKSDDRLDNPADFDEVERKWDILSWGQQDDAVTKNNDLRMPWLLLKKDVNGSTIGTYLANHTTSITPEFIDHLQNTIMDAAKEHGSEDGSEISSTVVDKVVPAMTFLSRLHQSHFAIELDKVNNFWETLNRYQKPKSWVEGRTDYIKRYLLSNPGAITPEITLDVLKMPISYRSEDLQHALQNNYNAFKPEIVEQILKEPEKYSLNRYTDSPFFRPTEHQTETMITENPEARDSTGRHLLSRFFKSLGTRTHRLASLVLEGLKKNPTSQAFAGALDAITSRNIESVANIPNYLNDLGDLATKNPELKHVFAGNLQSFVSNEIPYDSKLDRFFVLVETDTWDSNINRAIVASTSNQDIIKRVLMGEGGGSIYRALENPNVTDKTLDEALDQCLNRNEIENFRLIDIASKIKDIDPEKLVKTQEKIDASGADVGALYSHPKFPESYLKNVISEFDDNSNSVAQKKFRRALNQDNLSADALDLAYSKLTSNTDIGWTEDRLKDIVRHPNVSEHLLRKLAGTPLQGRHDYGRIAIVKKAKEKLAEHFPDEIHKESVGVKFNTNKLRQLRDFIEQSGGELHKKDIPNFNNNLNPLLDHRGIVTATKVQQFIDSVPATKYNISHTKWGGGQRHNELDSKVLQVNITNDQVKKMKDAGVFKTFQNIYKASKYSQHPVTPTTIGWVRYTGARGKNRGIHIDEVQSDFGQSLVRQVAAQGGDENQIENAKKEYPDDHLEKIKEIVFQGKHPSLVLHEAFQQYFRGKKYHGTPVAVGLGGSKWRMEQSQLDTTKPPPGHHLQGYKKIPMDTLGWKPAKYGDISAQTGGLFGGADGHIDRGAGEQGGATLQDVIRKNIGFIAYPKLGHPTAYSKMMELPRLDVPTRYKTIGRNPVPGLGGAVLYNANAQSDQPLRPSQQKMSGYVDTGTKGPSAFHANVDHEAQHSIYSKIKQQKGQDFAKKLVEKTLKVLSPFELKLLRYINPDEHRYNIKNQAEELISRFHNYLQDPIYRDRVHAKLGVSEDGAKRLHVLAKKSWKKMQAHAASLGQEDVMKSEDLAKVRPPPQFPKLGIDNRRETEIINNPHSLLTKLRTMAHRGARNYYNNLNVWETNPGQTEAVKVQISPETKAYHQEAATGQAEREHARATLGLTTTVGGAQGPLGYALGSAFLPKTYDPKRAIGTQQHENLHQVFDRIQDKYGHTARHDLIDNLWNAIPKQYHEHINRMQGHFAGDFYDQKRPRQATEEKLARILNFVNVKSNRDQFHSSPNQKEDPQHSPLRFDAAIKNAHSALLAASNVADERWLKPGHIKKSESLSKTEEIHSEAIDHMLGFSHIFEMMYSAAKFLYNKDVDKAKVRDFILLNDHNMVDAFLEAFDVPVNDPNRKALSAVAKMQTLNKTFLDEKHDIKSVFPEFEPLATDLQKEIDLGNIQKVKLGGKHTQGSMLVKDSDDDDLWLLKTGSGPISPAEGVAEEGASQSAREAAFYELAEVMNIEHSIPEARLMMFDGKPIAAIKMLPHDWKNLDSMAFMYNNVPRTALEPYRASGELFKWAVLDYIAANTDRHGANIMVSSKDDGYKLALIDHGAAFAGKSFNPLDKDTWTPYYLRVWVSDPWKKLTLQQREKALPRAPVEKEKSVYHWVLGLNVERISAILSKYGINPKPAMDRLAELKATKEPIDLAIGKLWLGV